MGIKQKAISGIKWTTLGSVINAVMSIIQLIVLSRLLNPNDFGLMALVMVVIGFSQMFIDMGISNAIIYKQDVTINQLNSLYWLNVFIGILLFLIIVLLSPYIAGFYKEPKLQGLIFFVSITFLIQPFGQQFMILLQKNLDFENIAKSQIIAKFISFILIITLALYGYGVYSLVIGVIVSSTIMTVFFVYYGFNIYVPKFYFQKSDLKDFINFGLFQMGEKMIQYFNTQFDTILIGKFLGVEILGVYNIAKQLTSYPSQVINPTITSVTFPIMSKFNHDIIKLKQVYLKTINFISTINFPVYILIAILAEPIVLTVIGSKWSDAIPLIQIMSITFLISSTGNPAGSLLLSRGRADIAFYWNLALIFLIPVSIYIGSIWDAKGIAYAGLIMQIFLFLPNWKFIVNKVCEATLAEYLKSLLTPVFLILAAGTITVLSLYFFDLLIFKLIIGTVTFTSIYAILLNKFHTEFAVEMKSFFYDSLLLKRLKRILINNKVR